MVCTVLTDLCANTGAVVIVRFPYRQILHKLFLNGMGNVIKSSQTCMSAEGKHDKDDGTDDKTSSSNPQNRRDSGVPAEEPDMEPIYVSHEDVPQMTTFGLTCTRSKSLLKKTCEFALLIDGAVKFSAKTKAHMSSGTIVILEDGCETYTLKVSTRFPMFSLHRIDDPATDMLTMNITGDGSLMSLPRKLSIYLHSGSAAPTMEIGSRAPTKSVRGNWTLDFKRRHVIASVKNAVLCEKTSGSREGHDLLMIRKIGQSAFELDVADTIPIIIAFAVGIAQCVKLT